MWENILVWKSCKGNVGYMGMGLKKGEIVVGNAAVKLQDAPNVSKVELLPSWRVKADHIACTPTCAQSGLVLGLAAIGPV